MLTQVKTTRGSTFHKLIHGDTLFWDQVLKESRLGEATWRSLKFNTHFKETRPRFSLSALVKAVIPLLLIELLWSLPKERLNATVTSKCMSSRLLNRGSRRTRRLRCTPARKVLTEARAACGWPSKPPPERSFLCPQAGCYRDCREGQK